MCIALQPLHTAHVHSTMPLDLYVSGLVQAEAQAEGQAVEVSTDSVAAQGPRRNKRLRPKPQEPEEAEAPSATPSELPQAGAA